MASIQLLDVANRALTKLGARVLSSLDEDANAARLINANLPVLRRSEIRRYLWNFAMARASFAAISAVPAWGWAYAYALPSNWLRTAQVGPYPNAEPAYQEEGGLILTDAAAPLSLRYVRDVEDPQFWDAAFAEVFAGRLAVELCERITQSGQKKSTLIAEYRDALNDAKRLDAIENQAEVVGGSEPWIDAHAGADRVGLGWRG